MSSYQLNKVTLYGFDKYMDVYGNQMSSAIITLKSNAVINMDLVDSDPKELVGVFQVKNTTAGEI